MNKNYNSLKKGVPKPLFTLLFWWGKTSTEHRF